MSIEILALHDIPVTSVARAVQKFSERSRDGYNIHQVNAFIKLLDPSAKPIEDKETADYAAAYIVQAIVTEHLHPEIKAYDVFDHAIVRARELKAKSFNGPLYSGEALHELDDDGNLIEVKRAGKRGGGATAMDRARELFDANPTMTRIDTIELMVKELEISANTGSTYYAAFNKDAKRTTSAPDAPRGKAARGGESRAEQVARVFASKESWSGRAELVDAIVEATGCSKASANTFSYSVMASSKAPKAEKAPKQAAPKAAKPAKKTAKKSSKKSK